MIKLIPAALLLTGLSSAAQAGFYINFYDGTKAAPCTTAATVTLTKLTPTDTAAWQHGGPGLASWINPSNVGKNFSATLQNPAIGSLAQGSSADMSIKVTNYWDIFQHTKITFACNVHFENGQAATITGDPYCSNPRYLTPAKTPGRFNITLVGQPPQATK